MGVMRDAIRGGIAGGVATAVMDLVTTGFMQGQSEEELAREEAARPNGKPALENLVDDLGWRRGRGFGRRRSIVSSGIHFGLGVVPGALYGVLRDRVPLVGSMRGLVYGAGLWALNDEYLNTRLGYAGPYEAYPAKTHLRGLVGHLALGGATDTVIDALGG
jgi:hypothetical protein